MAGVPDEKQEFSVDFYQCQFIVDDVKIFRRVVVKRKYGSIMRKCCFVSFLSVFFLGMNGTLLAQEQSIKQVFDAIYHNKGWWCREKDGASGVTTHVHSGAGSTMLQTARVRQQLPLLLQSLGVRKCIDVPCGDFHWMRTVDLSFLDVYIGIDIVPDLIAINQKKYAHEKRKFLVADVTTDVLPCVDLILCRDCLAHLCNAAIFKAITMLKKSGSTYLLVTTIPCQESNRDIATGDWRALNLELPPFNFPQPLQIIEEGWDNKALALWRISDLPTFN